MLSVGARGIVVVASVAGIVNEGAMEDVEVVVIIVDSSSCSYLSPKNKEKYKNLVFGLIEKVRHRA